jgi:hypothetical protein
VHVRGEPLLGFDGGEVLQVIAEVAAQVLDEPVKQRREGGACPDRTRAIPCKVARASRIIRISS